MFDKGLRAKKNNTELQSLARTLRGRMSRATVARAVGVSEQTIKNLESGDTNWLNGDKMKVFAAFFNVEIDELDRASKTPRSDSRNDPPQPPAPPPPAKLSKAELLQQIAGLRTADQVDVLANAQANMSETAREALDRKMKRKGGK